MNKVGRKHGVPSLLMKASVSEETLSERPSTKGRVTLLSRAKAPTLELKDAVNRTIRIPFDDAGPGRMGSERRWVAEPTLPQTGLWQFCISLGKGVFNTPINRRLYETNLRHLWLQDKQLFAYEPAPHVTPSKVIKVEAFEGSLPTRDLYVYLPRGYAEHSDKRYPVLYMHDGQNVFEAFVEDSYAGSWRADEAAGSLIASGKMRECIIVGVSNGNAKRLAEYMPPYSEFKPKQVASKLRKVTKKAIQVLPKPITGKADKVFAYYQDEVDTYISKTYRTLEGREHRATCGSSMGGLFSAYLAWEQPQFAKSHALMSTSFWITRNSVGRLETVERFRTGERRDVRIWLDSGTGDPTTDSDDNMASTERAYEALVANGYEEGQDFQYYVDQGAIHHESAWAARLDKVFPFLFPV